MKLGISENVESKFQRVCRSSLFALIFLFASRTNKDFSKSVRYSSIDITR